MTSVRSISVVVAARDASAFIHRAISSALRQPEVADVIVVDDASRDATFDAARAASAGSDRLTLLRLEQNHGPAAARNLALARAKTEFVCVLDADDWIQDGRFGRMFADAGDRWDLLADDLLLAGEAAPEYPTGRLLGLGAGGRQDIDLLGFVAATLPDPHRPRRELGYLKPLLRRSFMERAALGYDESLRLSEDYVLYAQALIRGGRFMLLPACGYVAVERAGSLSQAHGVAELAALLAADERLVAEAKDLRPDGVKILQAHCRSVYLNLEHRRMLDAKRDGDWPGVFRHLFSSPRATDYILRQTLRARLRLGHPP